MPVIQIEETWPAGAGGEQTMKNFDGGRTATRSFIVRLDGTDTNTEAMGLVMAEAEDSSGGGLPAKGEEHPDFPTAQVVSITAEPTATFRLFIVVVEYSTEFQDIQDNPLNEPYQIDFPDTVRSVIAEKTVTDVQGSASQWASDETPIDIDEPVQNASGEWFDPPVQINLYPGVIVAAKNVAKGSVSLDEMQSFKGSMNDQSITVAGFDIPQWAGLMTGFSGAFQESNGIEFYRITYRIEIKDDLWPTKILNRGFMQLIAGEQQPIVTVDGTSLVTKPVSLFADGTWSSSIPPSNYRVFGLLKERDWSTLTITLPSSI